MLGSVVDAVGRAGLLVEARHHHVHRRPHRLQLHRQVLGACGDTRGTCHARHINRLRRPCRWPFSIKRPSWLTVVMLRSTCESGLRSTPLFLPHSLKATHPPCRPAARRMRCHRPAVRPRPCPLLASAADACAPRTSGSAALLPPPAAVAWTDTGCRTEDQYTQVIVIRMWYRHVWQELREQDIWTGHLIQVVALTHRSCSMVALNLRPSTSSSLIDSSTSPWRTTIDQQNHDQPFASRKKTVSLGQRR